MTAQMKVPGSRCENLEINDTSKHAVPLAVCFRAEKSVPDFFNAKKTE